MSRTKEQSIGNRIKKARMKLGLSRRFLTLLLYKEGVEITEQTLKNWESGKSSPQISVISSLSKALKVDTTFFLS